MFLAFIFQLISIIGMLLASNNHNMAFIFSIFYGLCVNAYMSGPVFLSTDIFGKKEASVNLATLSLLFAIVFALGSFLFGIFKETTVFLNAWIAMIFFLIIGIMLR